MTSPKGESKMVAWFILIVSLCVAALAKFISSLLLSRPKNLPPGPPSIPLVGNPIWLVRPISDLESVLRALRPRYGPLITLRIGHRPFVFVAAHSMAHHALVAGGAAFSDRPAPPPTRRVLNKTQIAISSSPYGATWRLLRRNLTHEILHPSRVRLHSAARRSVLSLLSDRLISAAGSDSSPVRLIDHFQRAMFRLLVLMCFGDDGDLRESRIEEIEGVQRRLLLGFRKFNVLDLWPRVGKILFRRRWNELIQLRLDQDRVLIPLIRARLESKRTGKIDSGEAVAYVDTLADLHIPEENRRLDEEEMVGLCSEFLSAGTDTTSTALQWIMANIVKYPEIQNKLYREIISVVGTNQVEEDDLHKMPYLKAVVLEALRRHPPGHFVLPHKVTHDVELDGYMIPKDAIVNFMVAEMGWDPQVWDDPMEFKPERFLHTNGPGEAFDVTGSREIKMMPFGAGRRICPGYGLALLHLEYFVANMIWRFEWKLPVGDQVDLSEKQEFTTVMKNPLRACISPRVC